MPLAASIALVLATKPLVARTPIAARHSRLHDFMRVLTIELLG
jgi:hypothetical protein